MSSTFFEARGWSVAARFVTKVTERAAMPAGFVTNEVVTNRAGIAPFFSHLDISTCDTVSATYVCVCGGGGGGVRACVRQREIETDRDREGKRESHRERFD